LNSVAAILQLIKCEGLCIEDLIRESLREVAKIRLSDVKALAEILLGLVEFDDEGLKQIINRLTDDEITVAILMSFMVSLSAASCSRVFSTRISKLFDVLISAKFRSIDEVLLLVKGLGLSVENVYKCVPRFVDVGGKNLNVCFRYRLKVPQYLRIMSQIVLTEESWSLLNHYIDSGFIYIDSDGKIRRIIMEFVSKSISEVLSKASSLERGQAFTDEVLKLLPVSDDVVQDLKSRCVEKRSSINIMQQLSAAQASNSVQKASITAELEELARIDAEQNVEKLVELSSSIFPPCIDVILKKLVIERANLTHHQRFALAAFLLNLGFSTDFVLKVFGYSPDFNEKIARYQVEHIAGLRGSRRKYLPYNCDTMKTLGMCVKDCGVKNPLVYTYRILRAGRKSRNKSQNEKPESHEVEHLLNAS